MIVLDVILKLSLLCLVICISAAVMIASVSIASFLESLLKKPIVDETVFPSELDITLYQGHHDLDYDDPFLTAQRERIKKKAEINEEKKLRR